MIKITSNYFENFSKERCTGCRACSVICPVHAIVMESDKEGFLYPIINQDLCIHCDKCKIVCPVSKENTSRKGNNAYAAQLKSETELKNSSSGGMFIGLATECISRGGVVFGCIFDKDYSAIIQSTETMEGLIDMQGSKYVSSDTLNTFVEVRDLLIQNRYVLYTGTPCQIAGLKSFLKKDYETLITMDFLCHGVPSSKIFKDYIQFLSNENNSSIRQFQFRDKSKNGWGHTSSYVLDNNKKVYKLNDANPYSYGFLNGYLNRYSCYNCPFTGSSRIADFTVADFWGVQRYHPRFQAEKGVSLLLVNSEKAELFFESINEKFVFENSRIEYMAIENTSLIDTEVARSIPKLRKSIYYLLNEKGFEYLANNELKRTFSIKNVAKDYLPQEVKKMIKRFFRI